MSSLPCITIGAIDGVIHIAQWVTISLNRYFDLSHKIAFSQTTNSRR